MAHIPSDSDWRKIVQAVRFVLSQGVFRATIQKLIPPPPDVEFLMKGDADIAKGETGEMKFYVENSADDWIENTNLTPIDVYAEIGDYTANKKAYVKKVRGKFRIMNAECG